MGNGNMKDIRIRIKSVESTIQITKAMELVASSKLRKAKERAEKIRPYFKELYNTMKDISEIDSSLNLIYTKNSKENKRLYIVVSADRGLAGGFNVNLFKHVYSKINKKTDSVISIGRKAIDSFRRENINIISEDSNLGEKISASDALDIANIAVNEYRKGNVDAVYIAYTFTVSPIQQEPEILKILPINFDNSEKKNKSKELVLYEPSPEEVFETIVPQYVSGIILGAIIESYAAEQAARRMAMENATDNGNEMLSDLSLYYNRARQANITQEISEIVSGSNL